MARCGCGGGSCNCYVEGGTGVTVTGSGSAANPFVVSTSTTDCATVRPCISAGNGASYNSGTGVISARPSTDPGNLVEFGTDGGLYATTDCAQVRACLSGGTGINYDPNTGLIEATGGGGTTVVTAGDTTTVNNTVTGTGSLVDPYVVSSAVILDPTPPGGGTNLINAGPDGLYLECAQVRGCITAGDGATFNTGTGEVEARRSTDTGNQLVFGGDGGLFVPEPTVDVGCGLNGDGSAANPLLVETVAWPFPCPVDANGGDLYCDTTGRLRTFPRPVATFVQEFVDNAYASVAVPTVTETVVESRSLNIPNPDPCRPAFVIVEAELDVDLRLPVNGTAMYGMGGDDTVYVENRGNAAMNNVHWQTTKAYNRTIPAGGNLVEPFDITMGKGSNGATYQRIQTIIRAFVFNL